MNKINKMGISIIIPIYNVEEYLAECLETIYKLNIPDMEVILIDDGSTDGSYLIARKYALKHLEKTILIQKENGGLSSVRNFGIHIARKEYIAFIDSDDFIDCEKFETLLKEGAEKDLDVIVGNLMYYKEGKTGEPLFRSEHIKNCGVVDGIDFFCKSFEKPKCFREEVVASFYKTEFLRKNNLFFTEGILHEDSEFTPKVLLKAEKIAYLDYPFYFYRQRSGSIMSKVTDKSNISLEKICYSLLEDYKTCNSQKGKIVLSKLIISYYKVILYRAYHKGENLSEVHKKYKWFFKTLEGFKNNNFEETMLYFSVGLTNKIRKVVKGEITNEQKQQI